jgi:hypothetical protein
MAAIDKRLTITQAQVVGLTTELARKVDTTDPRLDGDGGGGALPELQDQTVLAAPPGGGEAAQTGLGPHLSIDDGALLMTGDWTASYIIQSQPAAHRRAKLEGRSQDLLFGTQPEFLPNAQAIADLATGYLRGETGTGIISSAPTIPASDIVGTVAPGAHHVTHEAGGSDAVTLAQSQVTGLTSALGGKVDTTDPRLSDARAPTAHHGTHEPGGSDPLAVNAAAATGSLRTLGTTATAACAGNDARLSDARPPTAHHASHDTGGSDAIAALSAAVLTSGTLPDARLSSSVARRDQANTFAANNTIQSTESAQLFATAGQTVKTRVAKFGGNEAHFLTVNADFTVAGGWVKDDTAKKATILRLNADELTIFPWPVGGGSYAEQFRVTASGKVYERGRTVAQGAWTAVPYASSNFTASAGTWTVGSGAVLDFSYALTGGTLRVSVWLVGTSVTGGPTDLRVAIPGGYLNLHRRATAANLYTPSGGEAGYAFAEGGGATVIGIRRPGAVAFANGSVDVAFQFALSLDP